MAPLCKLMCVFLFATLTCTSLSTSLSLQKIVGMIEAAKEGLTSKFSNILKTAEDQMKKKVSDEFENQLQNVSQQILVDILVDHNILAAQMLEVQFCLSHPCKNRGTCHATANTCTCLAGYAGAHCEDCVTGFKKKGDACIPDENIYKAMKPYQGSQYVIGTTTKNWNDARDACKMLTEGDLASAETQEEWSQMYDEIKKLDGGAYHWLGATGQGKDGQWTWVSGVTISSSPKGTENWYTGQPDGSGKQCMRSGNPSYYAKTNDWADDTCSSSRKFICEY